VATTEAGPRSSHDEQIRFRLTEVVQDERLLWARVIVSAECFAQECR
jgi:hypothetical protein